MSFATPRAAVITGDRDLVVVGSQSIHGAFSESVLPADAGDRLDGGRSDSPSRRRVASLTTLFSDEGRRGAR
jgi:hypothetical protein